MSSWDTQEAAIIDNRGKLHITSLLFGEIVKMKKRWAVKIPNKPQQQTTEANYILQQMFFEMVEMRKR